MFKPLLLLLILGLGDRDGRADDLDMLPDSQLFFDAKSTGVNRETSEQSFEGDVVAVAAGVLISGDKILVNRAKQTVEATGDVTLFSRNQVFTAKRILYHFDTGDFLMDDALMASQDQTTIERLNREIFGFSSREVEFEAERQKQLAAIEQEKSKLEQLVDQKKELPDDILNRYEILLEQQELIDKQENQTLARLDSEKRATLKRRREFWSKSRSSPLAVKSGGAVLSAYFRLEGDKITRVNENDYMARHAMFTPCRCNDDEAPAWAFHADEIKAQMGGYATFNHAVFAIKGIPILYLPQFRIPLKDERQSGFLMPSFGYKPIAGGTFTQPLFLDLGPEKDATITADIFERRGTRVGVEYRSQQREYSGFEVKGEAIRDRLWTEDLAVRKELAAMYREGYEVAMGRAPATSFQGDLSPREATRQALESQGYWGDSRLNGGNGPMSLVETYMATPNNSWRGSAQWRGGTFLAPRLSLITNGDIASDHRYLDDLYISDDLMNALFGARSARSFSEAKGQINLDGRDFYLGVGSRYGDNYLTSQRMIGHEIPLELKLASRYIAVTPKDSLVPVYGQIHADQVRISDVKSDTIISKSALPSSGLSSGMWRRLNLSFVSPWLSDSIVQVSQFADLEARTIDHQGLSSQQSEIRSWRTGLEFHLPIDGKMFLAKNDTESSREDFIHHTMDWRLRLSTRPVVVRRGEYGSSGSAGGNTYFTSDKAPPLGSAAAVDKDVPDEDRMNQHQRVTLSTENAWKLMSSDWVKIPGKKVQSEMKGQSKREEAKQILSRYLEGRVGSSTDLVEEETGELLFDQFKKVDSHVATPLTLNANIAYDFLDAKERKLGIIRNQNRAADAPEEILAEAWKPLNVNLGLSGFGVSLSSATSYNIYRRGILSQNINLGLPPVLSTTLGFAYEIARTYQANDQSFQQTVTRSVSLDSSILSPVVLFVRASRQAIAERDQDYTSSIKTALGMKYVSPSDCWGLQFAREKNYNTLEEAASYVLRLSILFMGQERPLPDMSNGVMKLAH